MAHLVTGAHLLAVLVPNGLGHARRMVGILARYLERGGSASLHIVGEPWQAAAARRWPAGRVLAEHGVRWHHGLLEPGVAWTSEPGALLDGRLLRWEERLATLEAVHAADVVVSDNLVGVLALRSDALLVGSFLWSDVFEVAPSVVGSGSAEVDAHVARFVDHERALLAEHRPEMLCVADLAMSGVLDRTRAVPVGWMCPGGGRPSTATRREEVLVLGGGTGAADGLLVAAAAGLSASGIEVRAAPALAARAGVPPFDPWSAGWERSAAVVCRAGAGTVTDSIDSFTPVVCVDEGTNAELRHNATRVEALGLGLDTGPAADPSGVVEAVREVLEPARASTVRRRMAALDKEGLDQGAEWLAVHCGTVLGPRRSSNAGAAPS